MTNYLAYLLIKTKCNRCGKVFERGREWGYTIGRDRLFCTYSCMRAAERADRERERNKRKKKP